MRSARSNRVGRGGASASSLGSGGGASTFFNFPSSAVALFSLRLVNSAYAGNCCKVTRSSDSTTSNIGFVNGYLDVRSAATFAAGSVLSVATWYDQSGNVNDAIQATVASQPVLQLSGFGSRAALAFGSVSTTAGRCLQVANNATFAMTGDQTIGAVMQSASSVLGVIVNNYNATTPFTGWGLANNGNPSAGALSYWSSTKAAFSADTSKLPNRQPRRTVATRTSGTVQMYVDGSATTSVAGHGNAASTAALSIGAGATAATWLDGLVGEIFIYASALPTSSLSAINASQSSFWGSSPYTPYEGAAAVQFGTAQTVSAGNVLVFEFTQPWTAFAAIQVFTKPPSASIIFTNVTTATAFPGYEMWVDSSGLLHIRVINNIVTPHYIGVFGSTNLADGKKHFVAGSYDGSGTAAGVKLYVDGVADSLTVESDTLASNTIIGSGQLFNVGNQPNHTDFYMHGSVDHFQLDNTVRSPSYIASCATSSSLPPIDANTVLSYAFNEGTGTSATDASSNNFTGTLTNAGLWVPLP